MKSKSCTRLCAIVIVICAAAMIAVGLYLYRQAKLPVSVPILMYHKIGAKDSDKWWVQPEEFEAHLKFLASAGYESILPSDLAANRTWGKPLPAKPVILTFDDGYLNMLTTAEPLLKKHGFKGIVYLITGLTGLTPEDRKTYEGVECLVWSEIMEMHARGVLTFGGHSVTHRNLALLADPSNQIDECYSDIVKNGKFAPDSFCYPYGQYRLETIRAVENSPFTTAMTCIDEVARVENPPNLLELPRVSVMGGKHVFAVRLITNTTESVVAWIRNDGLVIPVTPCLVTTDGEPERKWLPPLNLASEEMQVSWPGANPDKFRIELWDRNRVLKLYEKEF